MAVHGVGQVDLVELVRTLDGVHRSSIHADSGGVAFAWLNQVTQETDKLGAIVQNKTKQALAKLVLQDFVQDVEQVSEGRNLDDTSEHDREKALKSCLAGILEDDLSTTQRDVGEHCTCSVSDLSSVEKCTRCSKF